MPTRIGTSDRPIDMLTLRLRILTGCASHAQTPKATNGQSPHRSPPAALTLARSAKYR